ncbi:peptidase M16 [Pseudomonas monteilii]|uniref:Peptidase M16 n=1 Tax=Pseudomonas monteilii TaxID=76759 RepID=A0AAE6V5S4_9PSED|nr:pitrilysin family protein [Pseudomonas monteilii]QHB30442.1 peptidase M16 [Pseudomonas monteilii]
MNNLDSAAQQPDAADGIPRDLASARGLDLEQFETLQTPVQTWTTEGGTKVKFVEAHGLPIVDMILQFKAGTTQDTAQHGLAALTLYMLDEGSQHFTAIEQADQLERLGAIMEKHIRLEHATLSLRSLSTKTLLDPALGLFIDLVAQPAFTPSALEKTKRQLMQHNASRERHPYLRARCEAYRHLFQGHPYGNPLGSTDQGIEGISSADLRRFHQRAYCASNLEMVLIGDLSPEAAQAISQRVSQALPQGWSAAELPVIPPATSATINIEQAGASTAVLLALPMNVPANDPEYPALALASTVLGAGIESRLMLELRQRRGLTYGIHAKVTPMSAGGLFTIDWEIAPKHAQSSAQLVDALLRDFIEQGPTQAELQLARIQLAGQLLRAVAQNKNLADLLAEVTYQRQPADHLDTYVERIRALTPADISAVMRRRLDLTKRVLVSVGPSAKQQPLPDLDQ